MVVNPVYTLFSVSIGSLHMLTSPLFRPTALDRGSASQRMLDPTFGSSLIDLKVRRTAVR